MSGLALLRVEGRIATLTLNRPEKRNALSAELLDGMLAHLGALRGMADGGGGPTVCVVEGAGKAFCAGMDLKAILGQPGAPARLLERIGEATLAIRALPMATIAKVRGAAVGGGCGLACVCDLAITHPEAKLGYPEVDLGVCPAVVAPWLVKRIGAGPARRVLLTGGVMGGEEAASIGLATACVPESELDGAAAELAARLSNAGARALRATKGWLNEVDGSLDRAVVMRGAAISAEVVEGEEAQRMLGAKLGG